MTPTLSFNAAEMFCVNVAVKKMADGKNIQQLKIEQKSTPAEKKTLNTLHFSCTELQAFVFQLLRADVSVVSLVSPSVRVRLKQKEHVFVMCHRHPPSCAFPPPGSRFLTVDGGLFFFKVRPCGETQARC